MLYKKQEYDDIIDKITNLVNYYENSMLKGNSYTLFLSNGESIKYTFNDFNIAHLFGVDFSELIANKILEKDNYYKLLKKIIDDPFKYWTEIIRNGIAVSNIFSNYTNDKLSNFRLQFQVPYPNQIYFICKYDRSRNYTSKEIDGLYSDYFIARKNDNGDIVLLGLIKDKSNNYFQPQTSRVIKNDEKLIDKIENLLDNQIITYANGLTIENLDTNFNKTVNLNVLEITDTLDRLINISNITNAIPSTICDHLYNLKTFNKNRTFSYDGKNLLYKIKEEVNNRKIVNLDDEDVKLLDDSIITIIDSYNDLLVNNKSEYDETFSAVKKENKKLKEEYLSLKQELEIEKEKIIGLNEQLNLKNDEIDELNNEKEKYNDLKDKVISLANTLNK